MFLSPFFRIHPASPWSFSPKVYVDITMRAAKENDATTAEQYSRESVRIARTTRELLKKFAGAYHQRLGLEGLRSTLSDQLGVS